MHAASPKGFAAVARDHAEAPLDLHRLLVPHPAATFFMRAEGNAMAPFIQHGDLLVVDRSRNPRDGQLAIVAVDGSWILRRWERDRDDIILRADNPRHPPLRASDIEDFQLFGVVTWTAREIENQKSEI